MATTKRCVRSTAVFVYVISCHLHFELLHLNQKTFSFLCQSRNRWTYPGNFGANVLPFFGTIFKTGECYESVHFAPFAEHLNYSGRKIVENSKFICNVCLGIENFWRSQSNSCTQNWFMCRFPNRIE